MTTRLEIIAVDEPVRRAGVQRADSRGFNPKTRVAIVDYGMGNLQSVRNALERLNCDVHLSSDPVDLDGADAIVLPGVGAFGEAMNNLAQQGFVEPLQRAVMETRTPILGICLGMQLLASDSDERGSYGGLGFIPGHVRSIPVPEGLTLPHIGWNEVAIKREELLFRDLHAGDAFYFVHSYRFECDAQYVAATTDYGVEVVAAVQHERIFGVQFHPERSQRKGLRLLRNFLSAVQRIKAEG
jgi:glutamine amidotransferase